MYNTFLLRSVEILWFLYKHLQKKEGNKEVKGKLRIKQNKVPKEDKLAT